MDNQSELYEKSVYEVTYPGEEENLIILGKQSLNKFKIVILIQIQKLVK